MEERPLLNCFFKPQAVAVVGASAREGTVGHILLHNLQEGGFPKPIYPINPKSDQILGLRAYPSLAAVNAPIATANAV